MFPILAAFLAGILVSGFKLLPFHFYQHLNKLLMLVLVILLFGMGLSIGMDEDITSNIFKLGRTAFLISAASIAGSLLFAWYFGPFIFTEKKEEVEDKC